MTSNAEIAKEVASTLPTDLVPTASFRPTPEDTGGSTAAQEQSASTRKYKLPELSLSQVTDPSDPTSDLQIECEVGSGGLGVVDAALQASLGRRVAIKRVRPDRSGFVSETRLRSEAELMGRLEHPAIPPVHLLGIDELGRGILVMKLVDGRDWQTVLKHDQERGPLVAVLLRKHLEILLRVGEALDFAHGQGIIHRDIKPENVVIGEYGEVYLLDWGIAVELDDEGRYLAANFSGTPAYSAPEMVSRRPTLDIRTDVYLMGASLFQVLSGTPPHQGDDLHAVLDAVLTNPTPRLGKEIPGTLVSICQRSMAANPADRYPSIRGLLEDIRYYLDNGEMAELNSQCNVEFTRLENLAAAGDTNTDEFDVLGTKCRYGLERLSSAWPENPIVRTQLRKCLLLLCDAAISRRRVAAARTLLEQHRELCSEDELERSNSRKDRIDALADQMIARSDELSMSIQVRLVEQIAAQKRAYDDLLIAYNELRGEG